MAAARRIARPSTASTGWCAARRSNGARSNRRAGADGNVGRRRRIRVVSVSVSRWWAGGARAGHRAQAVSPRAAVGKSFGLVRILPQVSDGARPLNPLRPGQLCFIRPIACSSPARRSRQCPTTRPTSPRRNGAGLLRAGVLVLEDDPPTAAHPSVAWPARARNASRGNASRSRSPKCSEQTSTNDIAGRTDLGSTCPGAVRFGRMEDERRRRLAAAARVRPARPTSTWMRSSSPRTTMRIVRLRHRSAPRFVAASSDAYACPWDARPRSARSATGASFRPGT